MREILEIIIKKVRFLTVHPLLLLYGRHHGLDAHQYINSHRQYRELIQCLFFQKVLRINANIPWPVHFTAYVGNPKNIHFDKKYVKNFMSVSCYWQGMSPIYFKGSFLVAQRVSFISNNHDIYSIASHKLNVDPIKIGDNCLFSVGCVILPSVELGDNTIVAANAVVTKSFPEGNCVLAGAPAKIAKTLNPAKIIKATYKEFWG